MAPWPLPVEYHHGSSILWLSPEIRLTYRRIQLPTSQYSEFWQQHALPVRLGPFPPLSLPMLSATKPLLAP